MIRILNVATGILPHGKNPFTGIGGSLPPFPEEPYRLLHQRHSVRQPVLRGAVVPDRVLQVDIRPPHRLDVALPLAGQEREHEEVLPRLPLSFEGSVEAFCFSVVEEPLPLRDRVLAIRLSSGRVEHGIQA